MQNRFDIPFFSIIISTYNAELYLEDAITSIVTQENSSYEIIIIDGASNDKTLAIIKKYIHKISYFESNPDNGIYDAWNKALSHVKGEWLYFLGADDYLIDSQALYRVEDGIKKIESNNSRVVYAMVQIHDIKSNAIWTSNKPWNLLKKNFFKINCLHHQGVFHKRELFKINGNFNTTFKIAGDYEFLLRELEKNDPIFINTMVCCSRTGGCSTNINHTKNALMECHRAKKLHIKKSVEIYWIFAYIKLLFKILMLIVLKADRTENIISWYRKTIRSQKTIQKVNNKK
jgi:glycosyltransferase involved in cell wall biosynthesis